MVINIDGFLKIILKTTDSFYNSKAGTKLLHYHCYNPAGGCNKNKNKNSLITSNKTSPRRLPYHQSKRINICLAIGIKNLKVHRIIQHFRSHVALRADLDIVACYVHVLILVWVQDGETEIGNAAAFVRHDENIFWLDITMSNCRLSLSPDNFRMKVNQTSSCRSQQVQHLFGRDCVLIEIVVERPVLVIVGDEPELCTWVDPWYRVGRYESQNVFMSQ